MGAAEGLPFRTPDCTLTEWLCPLPFPLERATLVPLETACVPFRLLLVFLAPFELQRAPAAGRAALRAPAGRAPADRDPAGREDDVRLSGPVRRAVRPFEELVAGLRSRECAAGRLKWGRAAEGFAD